MLGILQGRAVRASVVSVCLGIVPGLATDFASAGQHHRTTQAVTLVPAAAPVATYQYAPAVIQAAPAATYQYAPTAVQAAPVATYQYAPAAVQAAPTVTYQYHPTAVQAAPTAAAPAPAPAAAPSSEPLAAPGVSIRLSRQERMDIYQDLRADLTDLIGSERSRSIRRQTLRTAARERYLDALTAANDEISELNEDEVADANSTADLILSQGAESTPTYGPIAPTILDYQARARTQGYDYGPYPQGQRLVPVQPVQVVQPLVPLVPVMPVVPVVPVGRHHLKHFHR